MSKREWDGKGGEIKEMKVSLAFEDGYDANKREKGLTVQDGKGVFAGHRHVRRGLVFGGRWACLNPFEKKKDEGNGKADEHWEGGLSLSLSLCCMCIRLAMGQGVILWPWELFACNGETPELVNYVSGVLFQPPWTVQFLSYSLINSFSPSSLFLLNA